MPLLEELDDGIGHHGPMPPMAVSSACASDAGSAAAFAVSRRCSKVPKWRASRRARGLAHMRDAEREDEAVERDRAARLDRGEQVLRARLAPALAVLEPLEALRIARFQREDVLRALDQALLVELVDALHAQAFDVEGVARHEVLQALARLRRADEAAGAAAHRILLARARVDLAHRMAAAGRACGRKFIRLRIGRALLRAPRRAPSESRRRRG